jgi:hypothetical protein
MRKLLLLISVLFISVYSFAQTESICRLSKQQTGGLPSSADIAGVSDTIHVKHYSIRIDTIDFTQKTIRANTKLNIEAKQNNVNLITLSLLQFTIDSVKAGNANLIYTYNDTALRITPPSPLNTGDSILISISYHGEPQRDGSFFGGYYFSGQTYAFNIGVGFAADPHVFGRCWYPCIDEFTDRSTYDFNIRTLNTYKAVCNGTLEEQQTNPDGTINWKWNMNQPISTYLASMAVAPFYTIERTYQNIPVTLDVMAADSAETIATFINLDTCLSIFIDRFGPYRWDKVGYVSVPFNAGAMEHASSIHIGKDFINGTLTYETLWAHELSHMWWGDLVTCSSQEDMWLNEGFAKYSEYIFTEGLYGATAYKDAIRTNHRKMLQFAHIEDGSFLALNTIPHAQTYGTTVYDKGADIAHTLRNYMGDSLFFAGVKDYMNNLAFDNADSYELSEQLTLSSGINTQRFFDDWVATPGFPHFAVDSFTVLPQLDNVFFISIYMRQKQHGNNNIAKMPLRFTFRNAEGNDTTLTIETEGLLDTLQIQISFMPRMITIDRDEKMSDAIADYELWLNATGNVVFKETNAEVNVLSVGNDSSLVRVEHHFVAPDNFISQPAGIELSDYHYWSVDGIFSEGFEASGSFKYDGSNSNSTGYLDNNLISGIEDSLVLYFRLGAGHEWLEANAYTIEYGNSHTNKRGSITVNPLKIGEYALGYRDINPGINPNSGIANKLLKVYPNPSKHICNIEFKLDGKEPALINVTDINGSLVYNTLVYPQQSAVKWDVSLLAAGTYFVTLCRNEMVIASEKVVIRH